MPVQTAQTPTQAINLKIIKLKTTIFGDPVKPNRRFNSREFAEELQDARIWKRRPRTFIRDHPYYDVIPEPLVNFNMFKK